jgi:DNA-binding NtrC family response regulator
MPDIPPIRLLIVDDHAEIRELSAVIAGRMGLECRQAESAEQALVDMDQQFCELMLADLVMGRATGMNLLAEVKRRWPLTEVALMSGFGSVESAVQAIRLGAYDFVVKPFRVEEFQRMLERMAEKVRLVRENALLRNWLLGRAQNGLSSPCTDLEQLERHTVQQVFAEVGGDIELARKLLGISRATLYRKIKRYGIVAAPAARRAQAQEIRRAAKPMVV